MSVVLERDLTETLVRLSNIKDKLLVTLATFDRPCSTNEIRSCGKSHGWREIAKINLTDRLNKCGNKVVKTDAGWKLTSFGLAHLKELGILHHEGPIEVAANSLTEHLGQVSDQETRMFLQEAINCCEHKLLRSAVIMSWLAAIHVLMKYAFSNYRAELDAEIQRTNADWKLTKTVDDYSRLKENDFLDRLAATSMIGKDAKEKLKACLRDRNSRSHPNSFKIAEHQVRSHIEFLILHVFQPFAK